MAAEIRRPLPRFFNTEKILSAFQVRAERERLAGHYSMLKKSLDHAEAETAHFETAILSCENEIDLLEKNIQTVARKVTETYNKIDAFVGDQTTSTRNEAATLKNIKRIATEVGRKEEEAVKVNNEIARLKVQVLEVQGLGILMCKIDEL